MTDDYVEWRTTFNPSDAPPRNRLDGTESRREYYNRLVVTNTLGWNGKWRDESRVTEKNWNAVIDSIASQLDLTDFQQERARRYYKLLPDGFMNGYENGVVIAALVVCGLSGCKDGREYHPEGMRNEDWRSGFHELAGDLGVSYNQLWSHWQRVKRVISDE